MIVTNRLHPAPEQAMAFLAAGDARRAGQLTICTQTGKGAAGA
jgi:hypothetical protein